MATIELVLDISLTVCAVVLALVCVMSFADMMITKFGAKRKREKERQEFLETLSMIADIASKLPNKEEEKPKKKTTKKKEEK